MIRQNIYRIRKNIYKVKLVLFLSAVIYFSHCSNNDENITFPESLELTYDFQNDTQSWIGGFSDYPVGEEDFYELYYEYSKLPSPLNTNIGSLRQSGNNHSDDLFMFIQNHINELEPNSNYKVSFEIEFASNAADGQVGVGGGPGESVTLKAGAASAKPERKVVESYYRMSIDKGNQGNGGSDMVVIGDFSNDTDQNEYTLKTLAAEDALIVSANSEGELWLIIGTDSGFEAATTIYYNEIKVRLKKQ